MDVFADDTKVFTGIAYKTTSPYKEVSGERHTFRIRPKGRDAAQPLAEPRASVPVACEVAKQLGAPLDYFLVRKLG